ncbi:MAG: right-handed parallel beta-helix repeat-containing protein [Pseudomonadota bacterium]
MSITRRSFVGSALALGAGLASAAESNVIFKPEDFGAVGDGRTDDSVAMTRLAKVVNQAGGGSVIFRRTTYVIGGQGKPMPGKYMFPPQELLKFSGCSRPLRLMGNGARLLSAAGQRFGVFGSDARPIKHDLPYYGDGMATPYVAMIQVDSCSGPVHIADFELAGEINSLIVGGPYGDTGWQLGGTGLFLQNNRGSELIERIYTHHHPLDGIMIDGLDADLTGTSRIVRNLKSQANGRQGCSIVGGRDYLFSDCSFSDTGRGKLSSAPGAGVDIEAEGGKEIRRLRFTGCRFANNAGAGMLAETGTVEDVRFEDCTFIGTTAWSAWPNKPRLRFDRCTFVGSVVRAYGHVDITLATQFTRCTFDDNPALSPQKKVFGGGQPGRPLIDLDNAENVLFDHCAFSARHGAALPWSIRAIYKDCTMTQGSQRTGYPRGQYFGSNRITGNVDLYNTKISGRLVVNGVLRR